jgi:hypothetical protein
MKAIKFLVIKMTRQEKRRVYFAPDGIVSEDVLHKGKLETVLAESPGNVQMRDYVWWLI